MQAAFLVSIRFVPFAVFVCIHSHIHIHIHTGVLPDIFVSVSGSVAEASRDPLRQWPVFISFLYVCVLSGLCCCFVSFSPKGAWAEESRRRGVAGHTQSEESTDVACAPMLQVDSKNYDDSCPKPLAVTGQTSSLVVVFFCFFCFILFFCVHIYLCVVAASTSLGL